MSASFSQSNVAIILALEENPAHIEGNKVSSYLMAFKHFLQRTSSPITLTSTPSKTDSFHSFDSCRVA